MPTTTSPAAEAAAIFALRAASYVTSEACDLVNGAGSHANVAREVARLERWIGPRREDVKQARKALRRVANGRVTIAGIEATTAHEAAIAYADAVLKTALRKPLWGPLDAKFERVRYDERIEEASQELAQLAVSPDAVQDVIDAVRAESSEVDAVQPGR